MSAATGKPAPTPHTPEPWELHARSRLDITIEHHGVFILTPSLESDRNAGLAPGEGEANARRIVACVNYCEGVSTPEIEQAPDTMKLKCLLSFIDNDIPLGTTMWTKAKAERDALEVVLRKVAKLYADDPGTSDLYDEQPVPMTLGLLRQVWAALSLVERKQQG